MTKIPNMWPSQLRVDVLTPLAVLRTQAGSLSDLTRGVLEAEVTTHTSTETVIHKLEVVAPALEQYRHVLLTVRHKPAFVYPARLTAPCFQAGGSMEETPNVKGWIDQEGQWASLSSEELFLEAVGIVLNSSETRSILESLLARSNDANPPEEDAEQPPTV
jgi:hypothetical protein